MVSVPVLACAIVNIWEEVLVANPSTSEIVAVTSYALADKLLFALTILELPLSTIVKSSPAKEAENELKSILSPSASLNVKVTKLLPGLALFVFKLALVLVNVIVGATLSVTLTVKAWVVVVPKVFVAVTTPFIWSPPTVAEPDIFLAKVKYPFEFILKSFEELTAQVTDWLAVNLEVVPEYPFELS